MTSFAPPAGARADFRLQADYIPTGDQPQAIEKLVEGVNRGDRYQTLLGVTGSGKTFTMANVIEQTQRPTLVLAHNKTLAAQLCSEFKEFFPENAVEYFVSYYDYYQPEAYIPRTDTYIAKDADINEEIDKLRHAATRSLFKRRDVIIVASVSLHLRPRRAGGVPGVRAQASRRASSSAAREAVRRIVDMQYERNDMNLVRGKFRLRGDCSPSIPSYEELAVRIDFFGDEVERIIELDPLTGELLADRDEIDIFPAKHFVTSKDKLEAAIADIEKELRGAARGLAERRARSSRRRGSKSARTTTSRSMREAGYCSGIENYSRHLQRGSRAPRRGRCSTTSRTTWLLFIDESHMTLPQVQGHVLRRPRAEGDAGRLRLPAAVRAGQPAAERSRSSTGTSTRSSSSPPTPGRLRSAAFDAGRRAGDPADRPARPGDRRAPDARPDRRPARRSASASSTRAQRALVTTLTKKMAEDLADYLQEMGIKTHYLHAEIDTLDRVEILRDLRLGVYDVVVGINLLREGLDLPEVSLVCILDADKEGYLRSNRLADPDDRPRRAPRRGQVIMYADKVTDSDAVRDRRDVPAAQDPAGVQHRARHRSASIIKAIRDITDQVRQVAEEQRIRRYGREAMPKDELMRMVKDLETQMKAAAKNLEFEKAALLRDQVVELRRELVGTDAEELAAFAAAAGRSGPLRYGRSQAGGRDRRRKYQK